MNEATAEESKGKAPAKESRGEASAEDIKTTSGLLAFIKASDMLIYNHLRASRLLLDGARLKIVASSGDINFLQYVKKDALVGICRDYFRKTIRLELEKGDAAQVKPEKVLKPEKATPEKAVAQAVPDIAGTADIAEPPFSEPEPFSVIEEPPVVAEAAVAGKRPEPGRDGKGAGNNGSQGVDEASLKVDTVLRDTLAALGGKVIDSRRITNV
ncbi:hypothetical protein MNBD_DELTA01-991 [hydrothermal vent metagenome]|uniref:DNA polymerase III subunits gamma and tau n=1 Tax=hydrothermal vent metagenome TaxID=652676 RepID=A0A3B0R098_9ZZZZ